MKTGHRTPRYFVVAVYPGGRRERVTCGKATTPTPFAKNIAREHARDYYTMHHVSTMIELESTVAE